MATPTCFKVSFILWNKCVHSAQLMEACKHDKNKTVSSKSVHLHSTKEYEFILGSTVSKWLLIF